MRRTTFMLPLLALLLVVGCNTGKENKALPTIDISEVKVAGTLRNVMRDGLLEGRLHLDSIESKEGLYGLGPVENLEGELLILDGRSFVSRVESDSSMSVQETFDVQAPFFVYANESRWKASMLPDSIAGLDELEALLDQKTSLLKQPFVFKMTGMVAEADIHVQQLPSGRESDAAVDHHQWQQNYKIINEEVSIVGFFSRDHQGIFTHHDSFMHLHLITKDKTQMGHLDQVRFGDMKLYIPMGVEDEARTAPTGSLLY